MFLYQTIRVRAKISSQIFSVEAPSRQGAKTQEYQVYSEFLKRSRVGCIGAKNVKLFLREPLVSSSSPSEILLEIETAALRI